MIILRYNMPILSSKLKKLWVIQYFWSFTACSHSNQIHYKTVTAEEWDKRRKNFWSSLQFTSLSHSSSHPSALYLNFHIFNLPLHLTHYLPSQSSCHLSLPNCFPSSQLSSVHLNLHPFNISLNLSLHLTLHLFISLHLTLYLFISSSYPSSYSSCHPLSIHLTVYPL